MQPEYVVALALAVVALALVAVLWRRVVPQRAALEALRDDKAGLERQLAIEQARNARMTELQQELVESRNEAKALRDAKALADAELAAARAALAEKASTLEAAQADLRASRQSVERQEAELRSFAARISEIENELCNERKKSAENLALRELMSDAFKSLAHEQMQQHSQNFSRQNREQIEAILKPLGERIAEFQQRLQTAHTETAKDREGLKLQIQQLSEASARMTGETRGLAEALKGSVKTQGAWGEMILGSILERSGLREGEEYVAQETHASEAGERLRPDAIVRLPREGRLVIDAKVSLTAFEQYVNSESGEERGAALARHLDSLRTHIRALAAKQYQAVTDSGLDYVIMFVPIEGALAAALQADPALTTLAAESNVAIATPTTLMIALRTVRNVWQMERRTQNAEQIAERAGKLYDKFVGFMSDMQTLGERLGRARECYDAAYSKLCKGGGNLVRQTELLKELGAKTTKALPTELLALAQDASATELAAADRGCSLAVAVDRGEVAEEAPIAELR